MRLVRSWSPLHAAAAWNNVPVIEVLVASLSKGGGETDVDGAVQV